MSAEEPIELQIFLSADGKCPFGLETSVTANPSARVSKNFESISARVTEFILDGTETELSFYCAVDPKRLRTKISRKQRFFGTNTRSASDEKESDERLSRITSRT